MFGPTVRRRGVFQPFVGLLMVLPPSSPRSRISIDSAFSNCRVSFSSSAKTRSASNGSRRSSLALPLLLARGSARRELGQVVVGSVVRTRTQIGLVAFAVDSKSEPSADVLIAKIDVVGGLLVSDVRDCACPTPWRPRAVRIADRRDGAVLSVYAGDETTPTPRRQSATFTGLRRNRTCADAKKAKGHADTVPTSSHLQHRILIHP